MTDRKMAQVRLTQTFLMHEDDIEREQDIVFEAVALACHALVIPLVGNESSITYRDGKRTEFPPEYVIRRVDRLERVS